MDDLFPGLALAGRPLHARSRPASAGPGEAGQAFGLVFDGTSTGGKPRDTGDQPLVLPAVARAEPGATTGAAANGPTHATILPGILTAATPSEMTLAAPHDSASVAPLPNSAPVSAARDVAALAVPHDITAAAAPHDIAAAVGSRDTRVVALPRQMAAAPIAEMIAPATRSLAGDDIAAPSIRQPKNQIRAARAFPVAQDAVGPQVLPCLPLPGPAITGRPVTGSEPLDRAITRPAIIDTPVSAQVPVIPSPTEIAAAEVPEIGGAGPESTPDVTISTAVAVPTALTPPGALPLTASPDIVTIASADQPTGLPAPLGTGAPDLDGPRLSGGSVTSHYPMPDQPLLLPASRGPLASAAAAPLAPHDPRLPAASGAGVPPLPTRPSAPPPTDYGNITPTALPGSGPAPVPVAPTIPVHPIPLSSGAHDGSARLIVIPGSLPSAAPVPNLVATAAADPSTGPHKAPVLPNAALKPELDRGTTSPQMAAGIGTSARPDPASIPPAPARAPHQSNRLLPQPETLPVPPPGAPRPMPSPAPSDDAPRITALPEGPPLRTGGWTIPSVGKPLAAITAPSDPAASATAATPAANPAADPAAGTAQPPDPGLTAAALAQSGTTAPSPAPGGVLASHAPSTMANAAAQQIAAALSDLARDRGTPLELALDPPELGRVRLQITELAGIMTLTIHAERPETVDLMRRHLDLLAQEFAQSGLDAPSVRISQDGAENGGRQPNAREDTPAPLPPAAEVAHSAHRRTADGALDLRL